MAGKSEPDTTVRWVIGTGLVLLIAIVSATYKLVTRIDGIEAEGASRSITISDRVKVIEGFLREKYPEFKNFARKESLSQFAEQVDRFVFVPPGAQKIPATVEQYHPQTHSIVLQSVTDQTEDLQVPPDADVWVFIPNLRRVRRVSSPAASIILTKVMQRGGAAVVVYGPDRKVKSIYLAPVEP